MPSTITRSPDLHAIGDDVVLPDSFPKCHAAKRDLVVSPDDVDNICALHLRHGLLRHKKRVFRHGCGEPDTAELTRPQQELSDWETRPRDSASRSSGLPRGRR